MRDLFAGSGQLVIEALSRGAKSCLFVDRSTEALAIVKANCKTAGVDRQSDIRQGEAENFLANIRGPFDLALLDPPFHHDTVAAVLPLLEALDWDGNKAWHKRLMAAVRTQAAFYPHFLEPRLAPGEELPPTELQILHLLCADKSNAEIARIMDVKLPTVKTHVSHILDKLGVSRRSEAKTAAKKSTAKTAKKTATAKKAATKKATTSAAKKADAETEE